MKKQIRYLTTRPGRNGTTRYFWQPSTQLQAAGWKVQPLGTDPVAAEELAKTWNDDLDRWRDGLIAKPQMLGAGTVAAVIEDYRNSPRFKELKAKTRTSYEYGFRIINKWTGDKPVRALNAKLVEMFYQNMRGKHPAKASAVIRVLRLVLSYAAKQGYIESNPAKGADIETRAKKGLLWSPAAVQAFVATADAMGHFTIGSMVFLNEWMGQRKGDVRVIKVTDYRAGAIHITQEKTGAQVEIPIDEVPELKARVAEQLEHNKRYKIASVYLFPTAWGQPYSDNWSSYLFRAIRDKAFELHGDKIPELKHLIFKDLRHTAVTRLAEAGCTTARIASITGHSFRSCDEIVDRYNIRTRKMASEAFKLRLAAAEPT